MTNEDQQAELLARYMGRLREEHPDSSSQWIRREAELLVAKKLGVAPPPMPATQRSNSSSNNSDLIARRVGAAIEAIISLGSGKLTDVAFEWLFVILAALNLMHWVIVKSEHALLEPTSIISAMAMHQASQLLDHERNIILWFGFFLLSFLLCHGIRKITSALETPQIPGPD